MSLFDELKRRKVFRVAAVYTATAFVVLQAADLLVEALGMPGGVLTGAAIVSIIGFPVALVLAWVFDVAPEREDADAATEGEVVLPPRTIVLVGVLLLAGIGVGWFLKPGTSDDPAPTSGNGSSIAVLPFENVGLSPEDEFFSHGIAEELIYALDRLPGLEVKARTSTWQFAGSNVSAQQVADSIDASSVLAGRVQRTGGDVRISVELVRGSDGAILWQDRFLGTVDDLFDTQAQIAEAIAGTLQIRLEADEAASIDFGTESSEAYDHFLRGRYNLALRNVPAIEAAIRNFEAAIGADSSFAPAWAGLGEAWMLGAGYHMPAPASELWANSNAALDRAIELDPDLPQPYAVRGYFRYWVGRWEDAEDPLLRALELDPEYGDAMQWLAEVYSRLGRMEEARRLVARALSQEPFSRAVTNAAADVYYLDDLEEAISYCRRLVELGHAETGLQALWYGLLYQDRIDEARATAVEWVDALGLPANQVGGAITGLQETFDAIEHYRLTGEPGAVHPALVHSPLATRRLQIMVGRPDIGIAEVEESLSEDHVHSMGVLQRRSFWEMRDDPRIRALKEKLLERFSDDRP